MKLKGIKILLGAILLFTFSMLHGQVDSRSSEQLDSGIYSGSFSWKPFTVELNTSVYGYGLALEKGVLKKLFLRTCFTYDFTEYPNDVIAYKIGFGSLYNVIDYNRHSFRTGLNIGMRQIPPEFEGVNWGTGSLVRADPMIFSFLEFPILFQLRFLENFSVDAGISTLFQKESIFLDKLINEPVFLDTNWEVEAIQLSYFLALRYTFRD